MYKIILFHCWNGSPEFGWYPYIKNVLRPHKISVSIPALSDSSSPDFNQWYKEIKKSLPENKNELVIVTHNISTLPVLKVLEEMEEGEIIKGLIIVAGITEFTGFSQLSNFFNYVPDYSVISRKVKNIIAYHSDNDPYTENDTLKFGKIFLEELKAKVIVIPNSGQFSPVEDYFEFEDLKKEILNMLQM